MIDLHGTNIEKSGSQFKISPFIPIACLCPPKQVRALGILRLLHGRTVGSPGMHSGPDLSNSCMRYIFLEDYAEFAKSEENTNVQQESQHCCHKSSVIRQVEHFYF
jgi:hypothetical protein